MGLFYIFPVSFFPQIQRIKITNVNLHLCTHTFCDKNRKRNRGKWWKQEEQGLFRFVPTHSLYFAQQFWRKKSKNQKLDNDRIWTCAGKPNRFRVCLLNHSDTLSQYGYVFRTLFDLVLSGISFLPSSLLSLGGISEKKKQQINKSYGTNI